MTEHPHEDVRRLFDMVLDVPAAQRESVLDRECPGDEGLKRRILAMIEAAEDDQFLGDATADEPYAPNPVDPTVAQTPREQAGEQLGRFKLLEQIGEGGFGSVWAAEQREPVKRRVALKIIKLGMDTKQVIARFEAERQALAMMDHPNIAKVLDAGSTETGRPFFVMELVKGVPILDYCDSQKLDMKARLDLFTKVCKAIQHAHQKGIIHRDIKPSNILITLHDGAPVPKVIDFGIAKATNQELTEKTIYTQHQQMIGTPAYMSPEQAEMSGLDIDTRSDIYSLGVLLYELLTGTTPFDTKSLMEAGFAEMMRIIREETPHKPSTRLSSLGETGTRTALQPHAAGPAKLSALLRGDMDWIVMKCLEKDRTRRYETANGLAFDIQRHLSDEPVLAGPPSTGYRLQKFVKRHRAQVIAAGVVAAALVLGVVGTSSGMAWALREKGRADTEAANAMLAAEAETAARLEAQESAAAAAVAEAEARARASELEQVAAFQASQLSEINAELMGSRLREAIVAAAPAEQREAIAENLSSVNFTNIALGSLESNIFDRAIETIDGEFEDQPLVRARLLQTVAETLKELGLLGRATDPQERALALRREHLGDDHADTLVSLHRMGLLLARRGKLSEAEPYHREALEGSRRALGDDHPDTLTCIDGMGLLLHRQGNLPEAEPLYREALERRRRVLGDDHPSTLISIMRRGLLLKARGERSEAEPFYREALDGYRRVLGDDHPRTLHSIHNTANLLNAMGRLDEAEPLYREALEGKRRVLGDDHESTLNSMYAVGSLLRAQGRLDEAEPLYRGALEGRRRVLGNDQGSTLDSMYALGALLHDQGNLDEAEPLYREALEGRRRVLGNDHERTLSSMHALGSVLHAQGNLDEAEPLYREALEGRRRVLGDDHQRTLSSMSALGLLLEAASAAERRAKLEDADEAE